MERNLTTRRRWVGATVLLIALVMLIGGETIVRGHLSEIGFLLYWLTCFGLTSVAILIAFWDVRELQRRTRQEQRELFDATLRDIEAEARNKARRPKPKPPPA